MYSDIPVNIGNNNEPYIIMPLNKTTKNGLSVECSVPVKTFPAEFMNKLKEIKSADINRNNILTLTELRNFKAQTEFSKTILNLMELYAQKIR